MSASIVTPPPEEVHLIKRVIKILAAEDKPLTPNQIRKRLGFRGDLDLVLRRYPDNFEYSLDRKQFVKLITNVSICKAHCTKNSYCPGTISICTGLHVCKFYILSEMCKFADQCTFGHDLATRHNQRILQDNFLDRLSVQEVKRLLKNNTSHSSVTIPKICKFYNNESGCRNEAVGKSCPHLHICKYYVEGSCRYGRICHRSHDILDEEVKAILQKHGISTRRTHEEILADLRAAVSESESGSTGSASWLDDFTGQQIGACGGPFSHEEYNQTGRIGRAPERRAGRPPAGPAKHSFTPSGKKSSANDPVPSLPRKRASSPQRSPRPRSPSGPAKRPFTPSGKKLSANAPVLSMPHPRASSSKRPPRSRSPSGQRQRAGEQVTGRQISTDANPCQLICIFNLRGKCAFAENCRNFHSDLPYQWLYKEVTQERWKVLPPAENLGIELSFSDPKNRKYYMCIENNVGVKVTFKTLTGVDAVGHKIDVCRLSTSSSVELENQPLTTVWLWYWKGETEWKMYGESDTGYKSDITSTKLEQAYLANPEGQLAFSTAGHEYILDFQHMLQHNLKYMTEREVCRRPQFVNKQDVEEKKQLFSQGGHRKAAGAGITSVKPPPLWNIQAGQDLLDHFAISPSRAENPLTKKEYKEIEAFFCKSLPDTVSIKSIERIENGDLWSNYVRYGKGSYFATTAKYSDCYTDKTDKAIFVVKVLVGEYTQAKKDYVRPRNKDPGNPCSDLYDSCVDSVTKPSIFVIFDNSGQVYPEYLVKYEYKFTM